MKQKLFTANFTMLILGQICSLFGNYILKFALSMYVLEVTGSAGIFASLLAIATVPTILFSPLGGILADRANRRTIMVVLDFLSGLVVLVAVIFFVEQSAISIIGILLVALSVLGAFESPTVQACIPQMQTGDNIIRANVIVNQVAAIAGLVAPILGSVLYTVFGLKPIMLVSIGTFFLTALFECFIKLDYNRKKSKANVFGIIKKDFLTSMRFIGKEQPGILRLLLLAAAVNFMIMGTVGVGLPYIVRTVLGLKAEYYGLAESILGLSAIAGSIAVSFLRTQLKTKKLYLLFAALGLSIVPSGVIFLFGVGSIPKYIVVVASTCAMQFIASIFSIFAVSIMQQKTPNKHIGKIMAYVASISMCAQPLGQIVYGLLFDSMANMIYWILIPTGIIACGIGFASKKTFRDLGQQEGSAYE